MRESRIRFVLLLAILLFPTAASASPWTLPANSMALNFDFDFQLATDEYLDDRSIQSFPLDAEFQSSSLRVGARYGFTDRFEGSFQITFKNIAYTADPAIVELPGGADTATLLEARGAVLDFTRTALGSADANLAVRYNLMKSALMITNETALKLPTGYDKPTSTIDDDGLVADDVTLGDGQADLENSLLFGLFIPSSRTFIRAGAGFRFRFGDPGHQTLGHLKAGQFLGDRFIVFAGGDATFTVTNGNKIGETIQSNGNVTSENIGPGDLVVRDLLLDKDAINVGAGVIFVAGKGMEIQASYNRTVFGRNLPQIDSVTVGTSITIADLTGE